MNMRKGSVSLYVVIFTTMLLSIISLGFLRIMMGEQTAARNQDLSNSAFDSAMAGVEDAKVVVLAYQECASRGWPAGGVARGLICSNVRDAIEQGGCDTVQIARLGNVGGVGRPETGLDQGFASGDGESAALDQAYTCVTIQPSTPDFLAQISSQQPSLIVPLRFQQEVTDIIIRWWRSADADGVDPVISNRCDDRGLGCFPEQDAWGNTEPPVMRWQLINPGSGFSLDTLNQPNAHASLFFVPTSGGTEIWNEANPVPASIVTQSGQSITNAAPHNDIIFNGGAPAPFWSGSPNQGIALGGLTPLPVLCNANYGGNGGYACAVKITLPVPIPANDTSALMRLTAYYNPNVTSVSIIGMNNNANNMCSGRNTGDRACFNAVQPEVDSTGRASNLFRRVVTRVDLTDSFFPYPEWALELRDGSANLCKNFLVWPGGSTSTDPSCH